MEEKRIRNGEEKKEAEQLLKGFGFRFRNNFISLNHGISN